MHPVIRARVAAKVAAKTALGLAALAASPLWPPARGLRVLYYHRVNDHPRRLLGLVSQEVSVSSRAFARQLDYLRRRRYAVLSADQVEALLDAGAPFPPRAVLITFDDGYADNHDVAWPLLAAHGCPALLFVATDFIGRPAPFPWDADGQAACSLPLTWEQVRRLAERGLAIGSHAKSHACLSRLAPAALAAELVESRAIIERETGRPAAFLAYPGGDFSPAVIEASRRAGYRGAFTVVPGVNRAGGDPFRLRRLEVSASDPLPVFALKASGALDLLWLKETRGPRRVREWLTRRLGR